MGRRRGARVGTLSGALACLLLVGPGCGQRAVQQPTASAPAQSTAVPLPEWAPKDPSPAFLRAAKVLKPIPDELWREPGSSPAQEAAVTRISRTYMSAWELFGSLADEQTNRLASSRLILIPVRSLRPKQRAALDHYFEAYRQAMRGTGLESEDRLTLLYKAGAREDLSNLDVGFELDGHFVSITFRIRGPSDEELASGFGYVIATL